MPLTSPTTKNEPSGEYAIAVAYVPKYFEMMIYFLIKSQNLNVSSSPTDASIGSSGFMTHTIFFWPEEPANEQCPETKVKKSKCNKASLAYKAPILAPASFIRGYFYFLPS